MARRLNKEERNEMLRLQAKSRVDNKKTSPAKPRASAEPKAKVVKATGDEAAATKLSIKRLFAPLGLLLGKRNPATADHQNKKMPPPQGLSELCMGLWPKLGFFEQSHVWIMHNEGKSATEISDYIKGRFEQ